MAESSHQIPNGVLLHPPKFGLSTVIPNMNMNIVSVEPQSDSSKQHILV